MLGDTLLFNPQANECAAKGDMRNAKIFADSAKALSVSSFVVVGIAITLGLVVLVVRGSYSA